MSDSKLDVRVYPIDEPKTSTVAFASVAVNDLIAIRGVRVVDGEKGLFVSMPQSQDKNTEKYHDTAFPVTSDLRKEINKAVREEYDHQISLSTEQRGYNKPDISTAIAINVADIKLDIQVYPIGEAQGGNTKAFASVTVDDSVGIRGVRVVDGEKGLFVTMPQSYDKKTNEYHDVAFPLNGDLRKEISKAVLEKYEAVDKSADKSLANGLKNGAEKSAQNAAAPKEAAAKTKNVGVLE